MDAHVSGQVRILVADDHSVVRTALSKSLELYDDLKVVGEAVDGEDAIAQVQRLRPDVVIMDASMPKLSGIEATRLITRSTPGVRVIGLSMHDSDWMARTMLDSGAVAFVEKSAPYDRLVQAIRDTA